MNKKGFTLIELLVVISIIALVSSIVLASVTKSRTSSRDSAVKSNLLEVRSAAELYYAANQNYGTAFSAAACPTSGTNLFTTVNIKKSIDAAKLAGLGTAACVSTAGTSGAWAVTANLYNNQYKFWCVDSRGRAFVSSLTPLNQTETAAQMALRVIANAQCN